MSSWTLLERALGAARLPVKVEMNEAAMIQEVIANIALRQISEGHNAWAMARLVLEASSPELQTYVSGIDDDEERVISDIEQNTNSEFGRRAQQPGFMGKAASMGMTKKKGGSGTVIGLSPKMWQMVRQELEANIEYYASKFGGGQSGDAREMGQAKERVYSLIKKIEAKLQGAMGAAAPKTAAPTPAIPGKPSDMTPAAAKLSGLSSDSSTEGDFLPGRPVKSTGPAVSQSMKGSNTQQFEPDLEELEPIEPDTGKLHQAHGTTPAKPAAANLGAAQAARGQNRGQGVNDMGDLTQRDITGKLIDQDAAAANPEEDPSKWDLDEAIRILEAAVRRGEL